MDTEHARRVQRLCAAMESARMTLGGVRTHAAAMVVNLGRLFGGAGRAAPNDMLYATATSGSLSAVPETEGDEQRALTIVCMPDGALEVAGGAQ